MSIGGLKEPHVLKALSSCYESMVLLYDPDDVESLRPIWSDTMKEILPALKLKTEVPWDDLSEEEKDNALLQVCPLLEFDAVVALVRELWLSFPFPRISSTSH